MEYWRKALGKIFLSHASADKGFVRRLKGRLEEEGYETWLDEKDLLVGDPLATKIFEAIHSARVVIVVVSEASITSNWLKHEVNAAARRMVEGKCRLIPVLIGNVEPPAEVESLLYADCRKGRHGTRRILEALEYEASQFPIPGPSLESSDSLARLVELRRLEEEEEFDGAGSASADVSATRSMDWDFLTIREEGLEADIVVDHVLDHSQRGAPITNDDWTDWRDRVFDEIGERYALLVSERSVDQVLEAKLTKHSECIWYETEEPKLFRGSGAALLLVTGGQTTTAKAHECLREARELLTSFIREAKPSVVDELGGIDRSGS